MIQLDSTCISSLSFADDLIIFSDSHTGLQNALNNLKKYCFDWQGLQVDAHNLKITFSEKIKLSDPFWQVPVYILYTSFKNPERYWTG
jgi:hypothetical protein